MHRLHFGQNIKTIAYVAFDWLHKKGWTLGHTAEDGVWLVTGKKGSKIIKANGATIEEALLRAAEQARLAVEMN